MLKKGDKKTIRAWAMYDWANSAYSLTITSAIFPAFYESQTSIKEGGVVVRDLIMEKYGIPNISAYSYAISAGFLLIAILAPMLAGIADFSDSKKRFMQFFCYLGAISCACLFWFDADHFWIGMVATALACLGFSGGNIFYNAYLPEIAPPEDHDRVSAMGFSLGYVGSVILLVWNLTMLMKPEWYGGIDAKTASQVSFLSVGIWWALFAQITFRVLPSKSRKSEKITNQVIRNGYREIQKVWKELGQTKRLKRFLIAFFVYNTGVQTALYMAASFAAKEVKTIDADGVIGSLETENLIISILLIQLVGIVGAILFSKLSRRFGNLNVLYVIVGMWLIGIVLAYRVEYEMAFYGLAAYIGLVMGGVQSLSRSTYAKFLPETKDHASYFSFYQMCYYVGTVLGTFGFGLAIAITNDSRNAILVIGVAILFGLIALLRVPKQEVEIDSLTA